MVVGAFLMSHLAIGHLYTALHAACASAVARVVEANGVDVSYVDLSADEREEALARHDIDILVSAWMPQDEGLVHKGRETIGDLYQPQLALSVLKDAKDGAYTSFIVTEESLSYVKAAQEQHQALKDLAVETIGEGALLDRVQQAHERGENPVFAVWQPHAAFHDGSLVELPDSNLLQGQSVSAQIILRDGLRDEVDEDLLDEMSIMMLGTRVMNALDYAVSVQGKDPEEAAEAWQRGRLLPR
ncbi:hypothetical protein AA15669_0191 [Saccharibacter floricola DSM 15669]|uniref:ABC-type glycine betaine transport system substrate-binding domain-containing protein n=2 Tax=Saccharibacter TaxID=231052 RepID=A0ABQ0NW80_9PROT|nr:hypothetical protein AA15669_0191 [Saccharibacter floricola DSM 15669]